MKKQKQTKEEKSKKMREIKKEYYLKHPEKKMEISSKLKGKPLTEEHKRKIGEANKITAKKAWAEGRMPEKILDNIRFSSRLRKEKFGYVNSPETRKKLSEIQKRRWANGEITKKQKEVFLSQRGVTKGLKRGTYRNCLICGKEFYVYPHRKKNNKFCSRKCKQQMPVSEDEKKRLKELRKYAIFPKKDSSIEIKIQNFLKQLNIEFFTHQYMHIEHGYQCDILIPSMNLIIEAFGTYWHKYPIGKEVDTLRCQELREKGYRVLVFWEKEIKSMELSDLKNELEVKNGAIY